MSGDPNLRHHTGFGGELLLTQAILVVIGLLVAVTSRQPATWLLFSWLLLSPIIASLVNETPHASRAIYLIIPLSCLAGLGWQWLGKINWFKTLITIALLINLVAFGHDYFSHYPLRSRLAWIEPYQQLALSFKDQLPIQPVYISPKLYRPELYFAYYLNDLTLLKDNQSFRYYLPDPCPAGALCYDPE